MATLTTGLATAQDYDVAVMGIPRILAYTNGKNRIQITDGVNNYEMGIDTPAAVATFDSNIDGSLGSGSYLYNYCYRRSIHGVIGNGSGTSATMTSSATPNDGIKIDIPANTALQVGVDQVQVYRTLVNGGSFFYEGRAAYSGSAIEYSSTAADSALGAAISTSNVTPQAGPFIEAFGDQFHIWGAKTHSDGTVTVTNASAAVTGANSNFTKGHVGALFNRTGDGSKFYTISAVNVSTQALTLSENYAGATGGGVSYTISRNPLRSEWSFIDSSANILPESFPADNYEDFQGGNDNEKATGIGKTNNQLFLFTNFSTWTQSRVGANTYRKDLLLPGLGCINYKTIANDPRSGDIYWQNQNGQVMRSGGSAGGTADLTSPFIGNILDGTHTGIHRNLRVDTTKYTAGHAIFYGFRRWYMLFQALSGATYPNACFIFNLETNPFGDKEAPSPWMMWTGFTAVCSGMLLLSGVMRPYFGDDLGYIWLMDTGTNDGVPSGTTTGSPTSANSTTLTDTGAAFYTTDDDLRGVRLRTYNGTTKALENDVVISSNTATVLTVA